MESFWHDLRFGLRALRRQPGFGFVAVLLLALGISANTAIFSVFNAVLLRPLPYPEADRLVMVFGTRPKEGMMRGWTSPLNAIELETQSRSFANLARLQEASGTLLGAGQPETVSGWSVSKEFFAVLRTSPALGRAFAADEDLPAGPSVIVLSHAFWRDRLGADRAVVGKRVILDGTPTVIIGVMPPRFDFPTHADFWKPLQLNPGEHDRGSHFLSIVGRLREGAELHKVQAESDLLAQRLAQRYPDSNRDRGWAVVPLREHLVGDLRPALVVLSGAVGLVLLIACGNVGGLLLVRALGRSGEVAVRSAFGAKRGRIVRQMLSEGLPLALLAGALGVIFGYMGSRGLVAIAPAGIPRLDEVSLDWRVLLFTLLLAVATVAFFGLAPALQTLRVDLASALKEGGRATALTPTRRVLGSVLVAGELMLTLVLLIAAGLLMRSFLLLLRVDTGFDAAQVLTCDVLPPVWKYDPPRVLGFYDRLLEHLETLPGVEAAAAVMSRPILNANQWRTDYAIRGQEAADLELTATMIPITPGYFRTMRIPFLAGRDFAPSDGPTAPAVVIVSESLARRLGGRDAIGQVITHEIDFGPDVPRSRTVIGVVRNVRQEGLAADPEPQIYVAHRQIPFPHMSLVVRRTKDPLGLADEVRSAVWSIDADVPVENVSTMEDILSASLNQPSFYARLLWLFASAGLLLTVVGVHGFLAYGVSRRRKEFGVRMALGASPGAISRLVLRDALVLAAAGLLLGLAVAAALSRFIASLLFATRPVDPATYALAIALLLAVVLLASSLPARRAARVDPAVALRHE